MEKKFRTPHTFDMNDYYTGKTVVLGGSDLERDEKETISRGLAVNSARTKKPIELDWSFLKKNHQQSK